MFINHEMSNGIESFTELAYYQSDSDRIAHPSAAFSSSKHRVGPDNYYLNQLMVDVDGVPTAIFAGYNLYMDNYRYEEVPRLVNVEKETYRFLQGFRGSNGAWDWETAFVTSKATSDDVTSNERLFPKQHRHHAKKVFARSSRTLLVLWAPSTG